LGSSASKSAATPARLALAAEVPKKSVKSDTLVWILSTPEAATGLSGSGAASGVPLLLNRSSVPAPDDEKVSFAG
jgi:hypothetical protein